ncbi:hypothetical protein, partial [Teichococcus coralli]|uniref:hypothetical protein n=1 Tax=Teichococcus coralli TaxID=2545983 RepID=UPI00136B4DE4
EGGPRPQGKGGPRPQGDRRDFDGPPRGGRDRRPPREDRGEARSFSFAPAKDKGPDPDSPFAVLARLKLDKE